MNGKLKITFCTGVGTVTGANFLIETQAGKKILVDCGMVQGGRVAEQQNYEPFGYDASTIDVLVVTHAHLDHVGRIPKLVKEGFHGQIYSTPQTVELAELVLNDAVSILTNEARQNGVEPLYSLDDVQKALPLWQTVPYHENHKICEGVSIYFKDAGHILGSAMVEMTLDTAADGPMKVLFTGDVGNSPAPLLRDTEAIGDVDYIIMESVYGDRNHEPKEERVGKLEKIIKEALVRGGTLIIPAFSLDRTQVLLYELNNMVEQGRIPSVPIFVDSPLGIKATDIYRSNTALFNDGIQKQISGGDDIFRFPRLEFTTSQQDSRAIEHLKGAKIILAGSGMSVGGRVISHEEHLLPDSRNTLLLVGYQSPGSLGRALVDGAKGVHIHGKEISVKAKVETIYGFSAHKDSDHLVEMVSTAGDGSGGHGRLKRVFVAMGEPGSSMHLAQRLRDELGVNAVVPERGKEYPLS